MRRSFGWVAAIAVVLLLIGVGVGAYNWGLNEGIDQRGSSVEVVRYVGGHAFGFFPFFLFFPLFFLAIFALKGLWWRRHWDHDHGAGGQGMRGPWERRFEDWHREQHEGPAGGASAGGEPV